MKVVSKKLAKSIVMQLNLALLCIKEPGPNVVVCNDVRWNEEFSRAFEEKKMFYLIFMDNKTQEQ